MSFDFYVDLTGQQQCPTTVQNGCMDLAGGFVDGCTVWFASKHNKNIGRSSYMQGVKGITCSLPSALPLNQRPPSLLHGNWLAFEIEFELFTPWFSKDDRVFHVLDNPVRKDRIFGVPFMSAASWKGLLRWACRMQAGLREHLVQGKRFMDWEDPGWILHLFGNEKGEAEYFHQGALVFYPTWFGKIGFEVINPHSRERRAGTQPVYSEVVPPGAKGVLYLLYAPWPGMEQAVDPKEFLPRLLHAIEMLLTTYGISAKRTVGWGTGKITKWKAFRKGEPPAEGDDKEQLLRQIQGWLQTGGRP